MRHALILLTLIAVSVLGYPSGKVLEYDGATIYFQVYYPDYDRELRAPEEKSALDIQFLVYWEYRGGRKEEKNYQTRIEMFTNTYDTFRFSLPMNTMQLKKATIVLMIEGRTEDTYAVNFILDGLGD